MKLWVNFVSPQGSSEGFAAANYPHSEKGVVTFRGADSLLDERLAAVNIKVKERIMKNIYELPTMRDVKSGAVFVCSNK